MRRALFADGVPVPDGEGCPTGVELAERVLDPVAAGAAVAPSLRLGVRVKGIIQRLELDPGPDDSVVVHMGIEFMEGAQPFNIGLAKVRNYLAILKRQERVPAQV